MRHGKEHAIDNFKERVVDNAYIPENVIENYNTLFNFKKGLLKNKK